MHYRVHKMHRRDRKIFCMQESRMLLAGLVYFTFIFSDVAPNISVGGKYANVELNISQTVDNVKKILSGASSNAPLKRFQVV